MLDGGWMNEWVVDGEMKSLSLVTDQILLYTEMLETEGK